MYKIIHRRNVPDLTDAVNEMLAKGWLLQGGIAVIEGHYYQALVKEELCQKL